MNNLEEFRNTMKSHGLNPPLLIEPDKIHRFPGIGKKPTNTSAWCIYFANGNGGCFGDFSSDLEKIVG